MKGVGGTPGSSHANPIQKEEKIFPGGVMGSMESSRADAQVARAGAVSQVLAQGGLRDHFWTNTGNMPTTSMFATFLARPWNLKGKLYY